MLDDLELSFNTYNTKIILLDFVENLQIGNEVKGVSQQGIGREWQK